MADFTSFTVPAEVPFSGPPAVDSPSFTPVQCATAAPAPVYYQRVYSSGLASWCYYSGPTVNPTPAPGDTTPNWTGAITAHEVLAIMTP